jgi:hypothetical protein
MYVLADFPVLEALARERTQAAKLDGRACFSIYMDAFERIDRQALSQHELAFMAVLGQQRLDTETEEELNGK